MTGSEQPTVGQRGLKDTTGDEVEAVRIWLLGSFRASVGSSRSVGEDEWYLKKAGNLIKLLALAEEHRLHREQVSGLLWPELDSEAAANNLHIARRTLEPSAPAGATSGYLQLRDERLGLYEVEGDCEKATSDLRDSQFIEGVAQDSYEGLP